MADLYFPKDFLWGCATASFQVEGAANEDGRGESIWDRFCKIPGKVYAGENGTVSCDQYHRFEEDIALMAGANIQAYRFSIAWSRIFPQGAEKVNEAGLGYYKRLINALLDKGIEPVVTLYHWDLPQALQDRGGWANRDTAYAFLEYAKLCFSEFGPWVKKWITLNEPLCIVYLGHLLGVHAPGISDLKTAYDALHHLNLAHGLALQAFRESGLPGEIGITWNLGLPRPATRREEDQRAVERMIDRDSRMFTSPVLHKEYPASYLENIGVHLPIQDGDMELIGGKLDFVGLNYYSEPVVSWDEETIGKVRIEPSWQDTTDMDWYIVPEGFTRYLKWLSAESGGLPIYVTENGCAERDVLVVDGEGRKRVHDSLRITYLRSHFAACRQAMKEGVDLRGYFLWSLIDNFEWNNGYSKRFGIIYCDYQTLNRIPKDSYYYYRDVIMGYTS